MLRSSLFCAIALLSNMSLHAELLLTEYIEGSSNNKALEIYNAGATAISLNAYRIEFYFNGNDSPGKTLALSGELAPASLWVVASASAGEAILAQADQVFTGSFYNGDDAIVLKKAEVVIDSIGQVGFDPGSAWTGLDVSTKDRTLRRILGSVADTNPTNFFDPSDDWVSFPQDTFDNLGALDGDVLPPDPEPDDPARCGAAFTAIHTIQGNDLFSPLNGQTVITEGIVVADFQTPYGGFFIQTTQTKWDDDPATSEGLYVYTGRQPLSVKVGDLLRLRGRVTEFEDLTELSDVELLNACASDFKLPIAQRLDLPFADPLQLEALEGMRIDASGMYVQENFDIAPRGEVILAPQKRIFSATETILPGPAAIEQEQKNLRSTIVLDDGSPGFHNETVGLPGGGLAYNNTLRIGQRAEQVMGVLDQRYGKYRIQPVGKTVFSGNKRPVAPVKEPSVNLRLANFNLKNFFNGDGLGGGFPTERGALSASEFARQKQKLVAAVIEMDADIIALTELENDGVGVNSALAELTAAINEKTSPFKRYYFMSHGKTSWGSDLITVGLIYRISVVSPVGLPKTITAYPFEDYNRQPMIQSFFHSASGQYLTVAVNHFKSRAFCPDSGPDTNQGDGQDCWNLRRTEASRALVGNLLSYPTFIRTNNIIITGDFNAYRMEEPIRALVTKGFVSVLPDDAYSYVFKGESGLLDYVFVHPSLQSAVQSARVWHINTDEPPAFDYSLQFKSEQQAIDWFVPSAYRSSDHDPVIVDFSLRR